MELFIKLLLFTSLMLLNSSTQQTIVLGNRLRFSDFNRDCNLRIVVVNEIESASAYLPSEIPLKCILLTSTPSYIIVVLPNLMDRD